jgi:ribosome recycling factor
MANITAPDAFLLVVQPWDLNALNDIENSLKVSNLGLSTTNDGRVIRISLPPLTEERRNEFIKLIHQKAESARIALRNVRQTSWEEIQSEKKSGTLTEDDLYSGEKDLNKMIEDANNKIKTTIEIKEKELKTI